MSLPANSVPTAEAPLAMDVTAGATVEIKPASACAGQDTVCKLLSADLAKKRSLYVAKSKIEFKQAPTSATMLSGQVSNLILTPRVDGVVPRDRSA